MFSLLPRQIPHRASPIARSFSVISARRIAQPSNKDNPPVSRTSSTPPADPTAPAGPLSESSPSALPNKETTGPDYSSHTVPKEHSQSQSQSHVETEKNWGEGQGPKRGEEAEKEKGSGGYDGLKSDVKGGNAGRQ